MNTLQHNNNLTNINLICIGSQRCGTTWLANQIKSRNDIFIDKRKEAGYFISNNLLELSYNKSRKFDKIPNTGYKYYADFTPEYLIDKLSPEKIYKNNPSTKVFVIVRHPVIRIISAWQKYIRQEKEIDFETFFNKNIDFCRDRSTYYDNITRWLKYFHVKIFIFEEIFSNPQKFLDEFFESFLNIEGCNNNYKLDKKYNFSINTSLIPKNLLSIYRILSKYPEIYMPIKRIMQFFSIDKFWSNKKISTQVIYESLNNDYLKYFENDIIKLSKLLNKDLSKIWK